MTARTAPNGRFACRVFLFVDFDFMVFCKEILDRENIYDENFEIDYFLVTI